MFTQRHYIAIAECVKDTEKICDQHEIAYALSDLFARDNPRFDREKFLVACGIR